MHGNKGKKRPPFSKEWKEKIRKSLIGNTRGFKKGMVGCNKGKKFSEESRKKMSIAHKGEIWTEERKKHGSLSHKGAKSWNWLGGKSFEEYTEDWTETLRNSIRERDKLMCQICGLHQEELDGFHKRLSVHHIDYDKKNLDPENLITLCISCHTKTNINREYWIKYFEITE
jgi:hypothetical protein